MSERPKNNVGIYVLCLVVLAVCFAAGFLLIPRPQPTVADNPEPATAVADPGPPVPIKDPHLVYENDFTSQYGGEWSHQEINKIIKIQNTPTDKRPYIGDFFPDSKPAFTLKALPPHKLIRFTFDLFLMKSWDGSSPLWGPGLFDVNVGGGDGRSLLHATFSNCGFFNNNNEQSFPDNYPARPYEAWTLAAENQSLGTEVNWGPGQLFDASGVYHLVFTFPHTASEVVLEFKSTLPDNPNKSFGLTNVKVAALPDLATYTPLEFDQLWQDLGSADPGTFFIARWKLVSAGEAATEYIAKHYMDLKIPSVPKITDPGGNVLPYPMDIAVIHRERARWVLEAIHSPVALELKDRIPTVVKP